MLFIFTQIVKYLFILIVYLFIYKIAALIYRDIKSISAGEDAKSLVPHVKLMATVGGKTTDTVLEIYPLTKQSTTFGRKAQKDIIIKDQHVSSLHARIFMADTGNQFYIEDMASANGTLLNGQRLQPRTPELLKNNDKFTLGNSTFVYSEGGR